MCTQVPSTGKKKRGYLCTPWITNPTLQVYKPGPPAVPGAPQQAYRGSSRGAPSPPAPCRAQSARAAGTPGGWGLLPGCFKKPSRKTQGSLGISSSGCQIEDDSQPSQEEQFGRKIHWRKKKKILILTCPPTHSHFPSAHPLAVCSHLGAMWECRRQKDLEKQHYFQCGLCGGAQARLRGTAARLAHVGKPFPAGRPRLQQRHFCTEASSGSLSITARSLAWCDYFWVIC